MKMSSKSLYAALALSIASITSSTANANVIVSCWNYCSDNFEGHERMSCHIRCVNAGGPSGDNGSVS